MLKMAQRATKLIGKQRVITLWCLICSLLISVVSARAFSLGLGDVEHKSYIGEPLDAYVHLINVPPDTEPQHIKVRQIHGTEARDLGIDLVSNWLPVKVRLGNKNGEYRVHLSTTKPIKEPMVDVLIELTWPSGKISREYNIFLNPPGLAKLPSVAKKSTPPAPATTKKPEFTPIASAAPTTESKARSTIPLDAKSSYVVEPGDSLTSIASRVVQGSDGKKFNTSQIADWLAEMNPQAFIQGNINQLIAGAELKLPTAGGLSASPKNVATKVQSRSPEESQTPPSGRLRLEGNVNGKSADTPGLPQNGNIENRLSANEDMMELLLKENSALQERLVTNSEYLGTLKSLVDEQRNEIEKLQKQLKEASSGAAKGIEPTPAASTDHAMAKLPSIFSSSFAGSEKGSLVLWTALGVGLISVLVALFTGFAYIRSKRNQQQNTALVNMGSGQISNEYEFSALWKTDHVSMSSIEKYYKVSEEFPENEEAEQEKQAAQERQRAAEEKKAAEIKQAKQIAAAQKQEKPRIQKRENNPYFPDESKGQKPKPVAPTERKRPPASNDNKTPSKKEDDIEIDEDLDSFLKL